MKSVLSIQSHVAHGYVGGKAAVFPLQTQGWEVDNVNTVNFSNHTGYGTYKGSPISSADLSSIFHGLDAIQVQYDAVLSGYIPNAELIDEVARYVKRVKSHKPKTVYLFDPVMGDQGFLYVSESCVARYRQLLSEHIIDIITPNQFELELLCGFKISSNDDLRSAVRMLHDEYHIKYVVISSLDGGADHLRCAVSAYNDPAINEFQIPIIKSYFTGVGDLFSALLLDKFYTYIENDDTSIHTLSAAVNTALTITQKVLILTHELGVKAFAKAEGYSIDQPVGIINDAATMKYFELKVIQAKDFYSIKDGTFKCYSVHPR